MAAARCKRERGTIDLLLGYGADINADSGGQCALSVADERHRRAHVELLLERGADLYKEDGVTSSVHSDYGLLTRLPELREKYGEINKRANRALKPLLK